MPSRRRSQSLRDRSAAWLRRHPVVIPVAAGLADRVGASRTSDDIVRVVADAAVGRLPRRGRRRPARLVMHRVDGRDQSVLALDLDWRTFEEPMPAVFWELSCRLRGHVVDVGANTGIYALIALLADRRREVTAFEPVPVVRGMLEANVALGGYTRRARIRNEAVGAESGIATLFVPPSASDGYVETSASLSADFKGNVGEGIDVPVTTLDSWWVGAGRPQVALVKIDVESREYDVLRGADEMVATQQPVLFYELLPQGDAAGIVSWARDRDLVDVRLRPDQAIVGAEPEFDPAAWNHMLVPRSRLAVVVVVLQDCGLLPHG